MSLYKLPLTIFSTFLILVLSTAQLHAAKRVALVIGNANYKDAQLNNPVNDALDMTEALKRTGFEVDDYTNINRKQMREAIRKFGDKLRQAETGLFYFAGHGIQIKGRNYLIPLAVDVHAADEVEDESIDASAILRKMESAGNAVNIVILDACRNNPFARSFRSLNRGLARMDGPAGSFIAYATAPGSVAADGARRNGLYTEHLLEALRQPGFTIEQTFKYVRNKVKNETAGKQVPWESSSLMGEFIFLPIQKSLSSAIAQTAIPTPPPLPFKHLQILSNIPHAQVIVNNVKRGLTSKQGALNISNLTTSEVDVTVQAAGYTSQHRKISLKDGQWEQLYINLQPIPRQQVKAGTAEVTQNTQENTNNCAKGKKVLLSSKMTFYQDKEKQLKHNEPNIQATIIQSFINSGMNFIDVNMIFNRLPDDNDIQTLASDHKLHYLLKVNINARELAIKQLKTNMKTINAEITLELVELKSLHILATVARSFNKASLNSKRELGKQLKQLLPEMRTELLNQACKKTK